MQRSLESVANATRATDDEEHEKDIGFYCPVQIETTESKKNYTAGDFDSVSAIQNAFVMIGQFIILPLRKIDPERLKFLKAKHFDFPDLYPETDSNEHFIQIATLEKLNIQIRYE
ncbi:hypothetical protein LFX25_08020 [Leptospira sp. FAT2]|uniref:DUF6968 family protein n=1 Tax=Leptospira sanjuanensis TaxID=2879643 RepID=UPI001EE8C652|nr:hypothetical protein [Leptospira sanjuanensis]MCG6193187.1 hypothetical protein [Leptospira sanjuanensis]